ncbi:MAG: DUF6691 family protein [Flavobacteriales bacterium]
MVKSEAVSWFRIYEMFSFQSFHMYGIIGSAVCTGLVSTFLLKKLNAHNIEGTKIVFNPISFKFKSALVGGLIFGIGWAMTGACPGPLFVNVGAGYPVMLVIIAFALFGAFVHGILSSKLPK